MAKILLIEDDKDLSAVIESYLKFQHHTVDRVITGKEGEMLLTSYSYDLVILDWGLPDTTGIEILKRFRSHGAQTPVLMLTGKSKVEEKETGFDTGADDYLTKPFEIKELAARVRALLRRPARMYGDIIQAGDVCLDTQNHSVTRAGEPVKLFPQEFTLLEFFLRHPDTVLTPDVIIDHVWKTEAGAGPETLRSSLKRLRKQIDVEGKPSIIENVHGVGYRLSVPVETRSSL